MQEIEGLMAALAALLSVGAFAFVLFTLSAIVNAVIKSVYERRFPDEHRRTRLVEIIDDAVKGYRDRLRFEHNGVINWECRSRRFTFHITLQRDAKNYILHVSFPCPIQSVEAHAAKRVDVARGITVSHRQSHTEREVDELLDPLRFFGTLSVRTTGVSARRIIRPDDELQDWREGLIAIIGFVRYLLDAEKWSEIERAVQTLCPYCRAILEEQDAVARCRKCRTVHHEECWHEQGRCSVFGCANTTHT
jgi:hypothetical protein